MTVATDPTLTRESVIALHKQLGEATEDRDAYAWMLAEIARYGGKPMDYQVTDYRKAAERLEALYQERDRVQEALGGFEELTKLVS